MGGGQQIEMHTMNKFDRLNKSNQLIEVTASCGRGFFKYDQVSRLEIDLRGRIWFIDGYRGVKVYTYYKGHWKGFSEGGTLRGLVIVLRDYIRFGNLLGARVFGPWPDWVCGGDLWGYGGDMQIVRDKAKEL